MSLRMNVGMSRSSPFQMVGSAFWKRPRPPGVRPSDPLARLRRPLITPPRCRSSSDLPFDSNSMTTTEIRPSSDGSLTVARSKESPPKDSRTPLAILPTSLRRRSLPARMPHRVDLTGPEEVARSSERRSVSRAPVARFGPCSVTAEKRPRPAPERTCRSRSPFCTSRRSNR